MIRHRNNIKKAFLLHSEWIILLAMLLAAVTIDTTSGRPSLCVFSSLGVSSCPGCGLGRSMALAAQGALTASFQMHPLGMAAISVLSYRILNILFRNYQYKNEMSYEKNIGNTP